MKNVNLIPRITQEKIAQRRRMRKWGVGVGLYTGCLLLACLVIRVGLLTGDSDVSRQIEVERDRLKLVQGEFLRDKSAMNVLRRQIDSANATGRHPNWGLLLDMVSMSLNDQTVLDEIELIKTKVEVPKVAAKKSQESQKKPVPTRTEFSLKLRGRSQTVEAMGQTLVELEKCKAFRQVKLGDNRRIDSASTSIIEFNVTCLLDTSDQVSNGGDAK